MKHYATETSIRDAVDGGGLLVVAQWEAKPGEADKVAAILDRFLPEAQREAGVKLFLISRGKDNPSQFLFCELFRDEAAFKAHQDSVHFKDFRPVVSELVAERTVEVFTVVSEGKPKR